MNLLQWKWGCKLKQNHRFNGFCKKKFYSYYILTSLHLCAFRSCSTLRYFDLLFLFSKTCLLFRSWRGTAWFTTFMSFLTELISCRERDYFRVVCLRAQLDIWPSVLFFHCACADKQTAKPKFFFCLRQPVPPGSCAAQELYFLFDLI